MEVLVAPSNPHAFGDTDDFAEAGTPLRGKCLWLCCTLSSDTPSTTKAFVRATWVDVVPRILNAFDELESMSDFVVIEGATDDAVVAAKVADVLVPVTPIPAVDCESLELFDFLRFCFSECNFAEIGVATVEVSIVRGKSKVCDNAESKSESPIADCLVGNEECNALMGFGLLGRYETLLSGFECRKIFRRTEFA